MISLAYNVQGWMGYPRHCLEGMSSRSVGKLFSEALAKYNPDIITLSEASLGPILDTVIKELGVNHVIFPSSLSWPGVVLTKYRILQSESYSLKRKYWSKGLFTRHWGRVLLETDSPVIAIHSLHLFPGPHPEVRKLEIPEVLRVSKEDTDLGYSAIVQGDLNHGPGVYAYRLWKNAGFVDAFVETRAREDRTFRSDNPRFRLDYIFALGPVSENLLECRVLNEPPFNSNKKGNEEYALSDHLPVMAIFS